MTERDAIIKALGPYFHIKELVCPHCYAKYGECGWQFFDTNLLYGVLLIRESILCRPMYVNGKTHTQRGLRCNLCQIVKDKTDSGVLYLSPHPMGKAIDFTVSGMSAEEARRRIKQHAAQFPCNIRLEKDVSWVHFDVVQQYGITDKVYEFKA